MRATFASLCFALALAACGDDPSAPVIANLSIVPDRGIHPGGTITAMVDFTDEDGDLVGGVAELGLLRSSESEGDVFRIGLSFDGAPKRGMVQVAVTLPESTIPGLYDLALVLIDHAGRRSAPLVAEIAIE